MTTALLALGLLTCLRLKPALTALTLFLLGLAWLLWASYDIQIILLPKG